MRLQRQLREGVASVEQLQRAYTLRMMSKRLTVLLLLSLSLQPASHTVFRSVALFFATRAENCLRPSLFHPRDLSVSFRCCRIHSLLEDEWRHGEHRR